MKTDFKPWLYRELDRISELIIGHETDEHIAVHAIAIIEAIEETDTVLDASEGLYNLWEFYKIQVCNEHTPRDVISEFIYNVYTTSLDYLHTKEYYNIVANLCVLGDTLQDTKDKKQHKVIINAIDMYLDKLNTQQKETHER